MWVCAEMANAFKIRFIYIYASEKLPNDIQQLESGLFIVD